MTRDDLENLREGWDFEAKAACGADGRGVIPASFWETYSAMANTFGGRVLLGARERKDGTLEPAGIVDVDKVEGELWNALNDRAKVSCNLLTRDAVSRIEVDGLTLLQIDIPKADRTQRPVFIKGSLLASTFVRLADGDRRADADAVRRMVADSDPSRDTHVLPTYEFRDLDEVALRQYREIFIARRQGHASPPTTVPSSSRRFAPGPATARMASKGPLARACSCSDVNRQFGISILTGISAIKSRRLSSSAGPIESPPMEPGKQTSSTSIGASRTSSSQV